MKQFQMDGWVTSGKIETRQTATGKLVTSFSVNSPERRQDKQTGEWESVPMFFDCQYWHRGDRDFRAQSIASGARLVLSGEPRYESWEKDGQKRSKVVFNVRDLYEVKGRDDGGSQPAYGAQGGYGQQPDLYDENIPF